MRLLISLLVLGTFLSAEPSLSKAGTIELKKLKENSALIRSQVNPDYFWSLNDSGHGPELFVLTAEGRVLTPNGIEVKGADNVDWEDLAVDGHGNLIIADMGNNGNKRTNLGIYVVPEPTDFADLPERLEVSRHIQVKYPDQTAFPPEQRNFDCEAVFVFEGKIYVMTKHRADLNTKLYRLDDNRAGDVRTLTRVGDFANVGQPTAADLHRDGKTLAVLSYHGLWIFERPADSDRFLSGKNRFYALNMRQMKQCEGMCWVGDRLLISNEQRSLFWLDL